MKRTKRKNKTGIVYILVMIAVFIISTGISFFYLKEKFEFDSSFIDEIVSGQVRTEQKQREEDGRMLYETNEIAQDDDYTEKGRDSSLAAAEGSIREYIKAYKVRLLDLYMDKEGIVYVDLGVELKKNFGEDASEELNIISGLYRSIEKAVPGFTALKILIEGHETSTLGGHIDILRPIRSEIAENN